MAETKVLTEAMVSTLLPSNVLRNMGTVQDMDTLTTPGIYFAGYSTQNKSEGSDYGIVIVFAMSDVRAQLYICLTSSSLRWRIYNKGIIAPASWHSVK